jgi:hypothetical protein
MSRSMLVAGKVDAGHRHALRCIRVYSWLIKMSIFITGICVSKVAAGHRLTFRSIRVHSCPAVVEFFALFAPFCG